MLAAAAILYGRGLSRLWNRAGTARGIGMLEAVAFALGMAVLALALLSPLETITGTLLTAHMTQHVLLVAVAPPLILTGRPDAAFAFAMPDEMARIPSSGSCAASPGRFPPPRCMRWRSGSGMRRDRSRPRCKTKRCMIWSMRASSYRAPLLAERHRCFPQPFVADRRDRRNARHPDPERVPGRAAHAERKATLSILFRVGALGAFADRGPATCRTRHVGADGRHLSDRGPVARRAADRRRRAAGITARSSLDQM